MTQPGNGQVGTAGTAVRQASLREHNLALLLRHIADAPRPPSRADLATATGLTRATVSALVDDLIGGHLLTEVDPAPRTGAGRPALGLVLATDGPAGLGLEINVDYLAACVVDLTGAVRHRAVRRVDLRPISPAEVLNDLGDLAATARAEAARQRLTLAGTALAVPGLVTESGVVRLAPNLGWRDVDLVGGLNTHPALAGHRLSVPGQPGAVIPAPTRPAARIPGPANPRRRAGNGGWLTIDNEANLAALGELHAGPPGPATFLYVSGEIGIGAGIVLHGTLFRGARGWSGELGHLPVHPTGRPCRCGSRGCLEQYAGQEAILTGAGLAGRGLPADAAIARLAELAGTGDPAALAALTEAATALGVAIAGVINLLDLDTVVLGGIYAPLAQWLRPPLEIEIRTRVLTAAWSPVSIRPSLLTRDAAVLGAAGSIVRTVLANPAPWLTP
ncbi:ROK family transcriptional regulator [Micromonospora sp. NBC_01796]|uniref:ROK family transcriptional regulator n=1 Tax=Micromonospora sp. NBC_01796 TaxID=2975987 RepID=UPI002DD8C962|nr:ROK family transcriptional regulator [Micromonospora sp. NBC_01796]WSA89640.1 ROK family transcriptional regulator [Micromonospora sp. NBC_01796]